mgnify:CR=1 FL=1
MRFAFTDDQLAFRDAVRDLLTKECPPEVVRAAWPDGVDEHGARKGEGARADAARVEAVWRTLAEMGVLGIAVGEEGGGLGMSELDWVGVAEETGYAAVPHPFVETVCVVAPLLDEVGDPHGVLGEGPGQGEEYRWYRWDLLPSVILFDFRNYDIQDAYLKRLAFFVEKRGFVGRLAPNQEIAPLHGWNAHDYKAEDLARFFACVGSLRDHGSRFADACHAGSPQHSLQRCGQAGGRHHPDSD